MCPKTTIAIFLLSFYFYSCNSGKNDPHKRIPGSHSIHDTEENLLIPNNIRDIAAIEVTRKTATQSLKIPAHRNRTLHNSSKTSGDRISRSKKGHLSSIPLMLIDSKSNLFQSKINQDSVFISFEDLVHEVADSLTNKLEINYLVVLQKMDSADTLAPEVKAFRGNLNYCGLDIYSSEGMYYIDVLPDYFYYNFKDRVSPALSDFLKIRKQEMKEGFSEDAGLLISFEDVYQRIKTWEAYLKKYSNGVKHGEAQYFYETYLETLMTGMDNSPVFDGDTLSPEIKVLYEKIMKEKLATKTSKIISKYYQFLNKNDFKQTDKIEDFLKEQHIHSMQAVQPHLR